MQDVTEIIGTGKVDMGFKAMIHTLAVSWGRRRPMCSELTGILAGQGPRVPGAGYR